MIYTLYQYQHRESGKRYIGVTCRIDQRCLAHATGKSGARAFNNAVKKYGIDAFDFKVLALFDRVNAACYHEQAAILKFSTLAPYGYNLRAGAPYTRYGGSLSIETKQKMKGNHNGLRTQFVLGYHPTPNTKQKMSAAKKRAMVSEEIRAKISASLMYHTVSPETKAKMSTSHKKQIGT